MLPTSAHASEWVEISRSTSGTVVYLDVESIRRVEAIRYRREFPAIQAWLKYDFTNDRTETLRERVVLTNADCNGQRTATLSIVDRRADGTVAYSNSVEDYDFRYKPSPPDSVGHAVWRVLCGIDGFDRDR